MDDNSNRIEVKCNECQNPMRVRVSPERAGKTITVTCMKCGHDQHVTLPMSEPAPTPTINERVDRVRLHAEEVLVKIDEMVRLTMLRKDIQELLQKIQNEGCTMIIGATGALRIDEVPEVENQEPVQHSKVFTTDDATILKKMKIKYDD